ncbi:cbb3-type cytochrome oxidase assembly protein CcoS [Polynucleobacter sp. IMCC30063]|uniref:cbb3-type cytochrome oxidase assembly protein CcoS n=1 Tax=unclassified Polynucleobacter TaxID=2640945 RepID=UPI001F41BDE7|nr:MULTISPECIES: cbb3-type cytochrome oxidase assembly protein CcoS [unclassified Polynucleobacter]MCE7506285.1 cbb3-type cytochrome oxidase assembly protein CcoS [Polynucleobacter sp. IMCC30063]MCE7527565.1 cbb3-type cytochrome oxidase assembly protein CcoS [Polynucleobacter sp. IMCC 30228]MCE7529383.1 cbb3-type cytochrome oxidase assembly protein CcoS [Polynucleobacter sp. IMCC 29146]
MESLYLLIPFSLILIALLAYLFHWSIKSGQFDDMDGPAQALLMDEDVPKPTADQQDRQNLPS